MDRHRGLDLGALLFGAILLVIGGYYLLTNTFAIALPELDWDMIWPLFVIALGAGILWRAIESRPGADRPS
jgi:uncharacterized integral membrane protein